ncbi:MAG: permease [Proteobacteria bacterium]|nr:MAG: permease [Pseudomonadota bacterium]
MTALVVGFATFVSTLLGGAFALRFKDKLHLILGFSAGAVIGVAFFDLLPQAVTLSGGERGIASVTAIAALGFMLYMVLDRAVVLHTGGEEGMGGHRARGRLSAGSLAIHSFLDGAAIGLGFQVSTAVGLIVAIAVLAHDFSDGINTVSVVLKNSGTRAEAFRWLLLDALAPLLGVAATLFYTLPNPTLGAVLALFAGFFIYIGASDLLPESYHAHPTKLPTLMTLLGAALLYVVVKLGGA